MVYSYITVTFIIYSIDNSPNRINKTIILVDVGHSLSLPFVFPCCIAHCRQTHPYQLPFPLYIIILHTILSLISMLHYLAKTNLFATKCTTTVKTNSQSERHCCSSRKGWFWKNHRLATKMEECEVSISLWWVRSVLLLLDNTLAVIHLINYQRSFPTLKLCSYQPIPPLNYNHWI